MARCYLDDIPFEITVSYADQDRIVAGQTPYATVVVIASINNYIKYSCEMHYDAVYAERLYKDICKACHDNFIMLDHAKTPNKLRFTYFNNMLELIGTAANTPILFDNYIKHKDVYMELDELRCENARLRAEVAAADDRIEQLSKIVSPG
jgi:hypothetical protein